MRKTVFIFGISSFVGSNLAGFLKRDYRVIGSYYGHPVEIEGVLTFPLDVLGEEAVRLVLLLFAPDIVIYCVGLTSHEVCDKDRILANTLNTAGVFSIANSTWQIRSKLIYISTAYVFSGKKKNYLEGDAPMANSVYGRSKNLAEIFIQKNCANYLILRCCEFYGRGIILERATWFESLQEGLFRGEAVGADGNIGTGFLDIAYLAMMIKICIEENVSNKLLHISSVDIMSRYEFCIEYTKVFNDQENMIREEVWSFPQIHSRMISFDTAHGPEYKIDIKNVENLLGVKMPSVRESLDFTKYRLGGSEHRPSSFRPRGEVIFI